jgi:phage repressor protein C with HTH and peptisase S24 domain
MLRAIVDHTPPACQKKLRVYPLIDGAAPAPEGFNDVTYIERRTKFGRCLVSSALFDRLHPNAAPAVIRISGDAMEPTYPDGCHVLVDSGVCAPSPPGVFVLWDGSAHVLAHCQVLIGSDPPTVRMTYDNPEMEPVKVPLSSLWVCGSVVGIVEDN